MNSILKSVGCALGLSLLATAAQAKLNVVATTPEFGAIATAVGGDLVEVTVLARPTEDPHFVDAKPSFLVKLNRADALIEGGADLEVGWLPRLLEDSRNTKLAPGAPGRILCNQGIEMLEVPATLDRSHGDVHAAGNPHFMTDPANARVVAKHLGEAFAVLDVKSADVYRANAEKFTKELDAKIAEWQKLLEPFKGQGVVAYHNSWPYFARRFGIKIELFMEPKPGIPPTPAHLAEVIGRMKEEKVRVIIVDPYVSRKTAETVAEKTGAVTVPVTQFPGGVKGTEGGYIQMMDYLVNALAKALTPR